MKLRSASSGNRKSIPPCGRRLLPRVSVRRVLALASLLGIAAQGPALIAQEPGGVPTLGEMASRMNPMNWKMPNFRGMLPGQDDRERIVKKKDGLLSDVNTTAKKSWTKTKEVMDPRRLNPMNLFAANPDKPATTEKKQPGFWGSLFAPPEPTERVASVNEFLNQERPK